MRYEEADQTKTSRATTASLAWMDLAHKELHTTHGLTTLQRGCPAKFSLHNFVMYLHTDRQGGLEWGRTFGCSGTDACLEVGCLLVVARVAVVVEWLVESGSAYSDNAKGTALRKCLGSP